MSQNPSPLDAVKTFYHEGLRKPWLVQVPRFSHEKGEWVWRLLEGFVTEEEAETFALEHE